MVEYISNLYCNKYKLLKQKPQMWAGVTLFKCIAVYLSGLYTGVLSENVDSSARSFLFFSFLFFPFFFFFVKRVLKLFVSIAETKRVKGDGQHGIWLWVEDNPLESENCRIARKYSAQWWWGKCEKCEKC